MSLVKKGFGGIYALLFANFLLFGASITLVGAILPRIFTEFGWTYVQAGTVIAGGAVGTFVATFLAGRFLHRLGVRLLLLIGAALELGGLLLFGAGSSVPLNLALYALIGLGQGCLEVGVNWSVVRMSPDRDGRAMNMVHGAFSIGAVLGPLLTAAVLASGLRWNLTFKLVALVYGLVFLVVFFLPFGRLGTEADSKAGGFRLVARRPAFWLGFALLFLYVGAEMGISNWSAEYFVKIFGAGPELGALTVSLFWLGLVGGRIGLPLLLPRTRPDRLVVVLGLVFALAVGLLLATGVAGGRALPLGLVAVTLAGLGASCIYPSGISLVGAAFPEGQATALGFASTGGGVGAFLFPYAMSGIASAAGLVAGFAFYAGLAALTAGAALGLAALSRRSAA